MTRWHRAVVVGSVAMSLSLLAVAALGRKEREFRQNELEHETRLVARQFATRLRGGVEKHLIALQQMANFFENSATVTPEEFEDFASTTSRLTPGFLRISAMDDSWRIRWAHPPAAGPLLLGFDVRNHPQGHETISRALRWGRPVLSSALALLDGPRGFLLAVPISFRDGSMGAVIGTFRSADFFASETLPEVLERYEEMVLISGTPVYKSETFNANYVPVAPAHESFSIAGRTWEVRVKPRDEVAWESLNSGGAAFWTLGALLTLGLGCFGAAGAYWATAISGRFKSQDEALREARQKLDGAMQQLLQAEKLTALGELVAGVAHEINNPLCSVMGNTQLLLAKERPSDDRTRLETVFCEAERMSRIVKNLLSFARKHPPEKKYLGLNGVIDKTIELKAYHFRVNQIEVECDLDPELPKTMLDFHQIQQVVLNLLNNAEQAILEGGRGRHIHLTTRRRGERIEMRISDDGPGIPAEIQNRVFEPFFTTKKEGKGTGLGLSMCYGIVQEHAGTIRAASEPGRGATLVVELPVLGDQSVPVAPAATGPPPPLPPLKILVVDDERSVQDFLVDYLITRGHTVDTASDAPEAVRKITQGGYELVISDLKMPHGSGQDIYEAVSEKDPGLARRLVFTTGDGASEETQHFLARVGNPVVPKPCRIEEIERAIWRAIGV